GDRREGLAAGLIHASPIDALSDLVTPRRDVMNTFIPKSALLLVGAIGYVMAAGAASAADPAGDPPSVVVRFSSDELTTDSGAHAVYRRLVAAANKVCP